MAERFDAITIGAGLGSLAAAAALANQGRKVLVLERMSNFGGAATLYRHGALTMEASLHEIDGDTVYGPNGAFARLGLIGATQPIKTDIFYEARGGPLPDPVRVPHGLEAAEDALSQALPGSRKGLQSYFREITRLYRSFQDLEDIGARGPAVLAGLVFSGRLFELIGDSRRTLAQRLKAHFHDDEVAKCALGAVLPYFDSDPAKMSFLLYAGVWARYVEGGSYYFTGGSRSLTMALLQQAKKAGGEARASCAVKDILLDTDGRACGVRYEDKQGEAHEVHAPLIFGGAAPAVLSQMLPDGHKAPFTEHYAQFEPSISLFEVSFGLSRPAAEFGISAYSTFVYPDEMQHFADYPHAARVFSENPAGRLPPYVIADYSRMEEAGLRQPGDPYLVSVGGVDSLAWWAGLDEVADQDRRARWIEALTAELDRRYPGFAGAVVQAEMATARTMKKHLGTPEGEIYGFRPTPERLFRRPPSAATPVEGLWLSSAYTVSGGYAGALHGGIMAADSALRRRR